MIRLDTVQQFNEFFGVETLNPLVSVIDLSQCKPHRSDRFSYGLYAIFLKDIKCGSLLYGINYYDYQEGTIVAIAPGQVLGVEGDKTVQPKGIALVFHPDLIYGTDLGKAIKDYQFFSYDVNEALHLSERERPVIEECFKNIQIELEHDVDKHTNRVICRNISLLLDYCLRFYDRQFITRHKVNSDILTRFESIIDSYLGSDEPQVNGLPSVAFCADRVCLSPNYFGDLIKKETGRTAQEYIQMKIIDHAKEMLQGSDIPITEIAEALGFKY